MKCSFRETNVMCSPTSFNNKRSVRLNIHLYDIGPLHCLIGSEFASASIALWSRLPIALIFERSGKGLRSPSFTCSTDYTTNKQDISERMPTDRSSKLTSYHSYIFLASSLSLSHSSFQFSYSFQFPFLSQPFSVSLLLSSLTIQPLSLSLPLSIFSHSFLP